ncbi:hypothetical protein U6R65_12165, partial [Cutibacterium acnes]
MAAGNTDHLNMNLGVGRGGAAPGGAAGAVGGGPDPKEEKRLIDSMRQGGATQQQIDDALKNYRASKGGAAPSGGLVSAGLGYQGTRSYTAAHSRDRNVDTVHGRQEDARLNHSFSVTGARAEQGARGQQSSQMDRHGRDAALSNVDERSRVSDVSDRREYGVGDRVNRSESDSFTIHKDLMADPYLFEKVAARNGMTAMRFM